MKGLAALLLCLAGILGCRPAPGEISGYRAGDYVVYTYHGAYRKVPVTLRKKVISKRGNELCMLVEWKSGGEARVWKQFFTDTAYNRTNNVVDRLVLVEGGKETELPNRDNLDLFRLYDGTYLMPQHPPRLIKEEAKPVPAAGTRYLCSVKTYDVKVLNRHAALTVAESAGFKWTLVSSVYRTAKGELLYAAEVSEHGTAKRE